jgi:glycosyltransferase involved in cell wall biosynthesis
MTMRESTPTVSVVIPTHNRGAVLRRTLDALGSQIYPLNLIEVLVVADGCTDDTGKMLARYSPPFKLRVVEQAAQGPAAARNHGASLATGRLLVFLDDDIQAVPEFIAAHVRAHRQLTGVVAIGYLPPVLQVQTGFFRLSLRAWWENKFTMMSEPGHRYTYRDLLSGNVSLEADMFAAIGGFDPALYCHEDYELGIRLIKAGASLIFAPEALGYHYEMTQMSRSFQRKYDEGRADVLIGRRHPELRSCLPLCRAGSWSRLNYVLRAAAFAWPAGENLLDVGFRFALGVFERLRMRDPWRRLLDNMLDYWYWRGVAQEIGSERALADFLREAPAETDGTGSEIEIDLRDGLEAAERRLSEERPASARIRYGRQAVGRIPPRPDAERLRGAHLRAILATTMTWPLLNAVTVEKATVADTAQYWPFADSPWRSLEPVYADESSGS